MDATQRQLRAIASADKQLQSLEEAAIARINAATAKSFEKLIKDLKGKLSNRAGVNLLARDRALLLVNDLRNTLNILSPADPTTKALLRQFESLQVEADAVGNKMATASIEPFETPASTANIALETAAIAATQGYNELLVHGETFANQASVIIQQGIMQGWGTAKTTSYMKSALNLTRNRAETIVRTETNRAANEAAKAAYKENGIEIGAWIATQDSRVCPRCAARAGKFFKIDEIVMPLHYRDRCKISPIKQSWIDAGLVDLDWYEQHGKDAVEKAGDSDSSAGAWELNGAPKAINISGKIEPKFAPRKGKAGETKQVLSVKEQIDQNDKEFESLLDQTISLSEKLGTNYEASPEGVALRGKVKANRALAAELKSKAVKQITKPIAKEDIQKYHSQSDILDSTLAPMMERFNALGDEWSAAKKLAGKEFYESDAYYALLARREKILLDIETQKQAIDSHHQQFIDQMLGRTSEKTAMELIKTAGIEYPKEREQDLLKAVQLHGFVPETLKRIIVEKGARAYATPGRIVLDTADDTSVLFHEFGHHVEFVDGKSAQKFTDWRDAKADKPNGTKKLNNINKGGGYGSDEVARVDHYVDPYVGKVYDDGYSEVYSMGIECFANPTRLANLRTKDRSHFDLIMDYLTSEKSIQYAQI